MSIVISQLNGGLGNQMFQYAAGFCLAQKRGAKLRLDISAFGSVDEETVREYSLEVFKISGKPTTKLEGVWFESRFRKAVLGDIPVYREKQYGVFQKELFEQVPPVILQGYWQSYKYLEDARDLVLQEFSFSVDPSAQDIEMITKIQEAANPVCVHVRRSDYISNPVAASFHGLTGLEYYTEAIKRVKQTSPDATFFVFSDDIDWASQNLDFGGSSAHYVGHNTIQTGFQDLRIMLSCKHFIIANSSFSWWAAWLSQAEGKTVIAPKKWIKEENTTKFTDLCPPDWVRI